jgi:hypothetical protein
MPLLASIAAALAVCELAVRCLPAYTTWWLADLYAPSDVPGVQYTLQPNFDGSAFGAPVRVNALGYRGPTWARAKEATRSASR